ncbi:MAG: CocE/NonD family hydrolase [Terriglobia bacterium]|jgi:hypothetical protein
MSKSVRRREFLRTGAASALGSKLLGFAAWPARAQAGEPAREEVAHGGPEENPSLVNPEGLLMERFSSTPGASVLVKSLGDAAEYVLRWRPSTSAEAWQSRRVEVESAFRKAIGLSELPPRTPLQARVLARHDLDDYTLENVLFESRPGFPVSANVYRPKAASSERRPAILCPIGHYISAGKAFTDVQARCINLARMGFVVLTYDALGQGERLAPGNIHHDAGFALLPLGETIAGWMVWDSMRAIDYLETLEDVDGGRIGVTGNSGGGLNTLFTAALDARVRAAVVVGFTFEFNNWLKYGGTHCTCTHLPAMFRNFEWFEVAGLIAPRALLMMQGDRDGIFLISGARRSAHNTAAVYKALEASDQVGFRELAGQPHAYSPPYREQMYGWMAWRLLGQGNGDPIAEGPVQNLSEDDPRLLCDRDGSTFPHTPSVVDLARHKAMTSVAGFEGGSSSGSSSSVRNWLRELIAPPEALPQFLDSDWDKPLPVQGGWLEKFSFSSEDGVYIPGWRWTTDADAVPSKTIIIVDDRGKATTAQSGLVRPLIEAGYALVSLDLRGRGETLGHFGARWSTNFRLLANQVDLGEPLAGRRAYDLQRALDHLALRQRLDGVTVVGVGDDALPALLAGSVDERVERVAVVGYVHSFVSQMRARKSGERKEMSESWNDPQVTGRLDAGDYDVDFGSVIPGALAIADVPEIASLIAPRRLLFCQARDNSAPGIEKIAARFKRVAETAGKGWFRYEHRRSFNESLILEWMTHEP